MDFILLFWLCGFWMNLLWLCISRDQLFEIIEGMESDISERYSGQEWSPDHFFIIVACCFLFWWIFLPCLIVIKILEG